LLLILMDSAAFSYQLLNLSLADLFFDNPFAIAALLSFELGALAPSDFGYCLLPSINPVYGLICLSSHRGGPKATPLCAGSAVEKEGLRHVPLAA
jgi:hypothetical protein